MQGNAGASPLVKSSRPRERSCMLLVINANNTNTVFAIWDGADLKGSCRTATEGKRTADDYVVSLDHLLSLEGLARGNVHGAVIATVLPDVNFNLVPPCPRNSQTHPIVAAQQCCTLAPY